MTGVLKYNPSPLEQVYRDVKRRFDTCNINVALWSIGQELDALKAENEALKTRVTELEAKTQSLEATAESHARDLGRVCYGLDD